MRLMQNIHTAPPSGSSCQ